MLKPFFSVGRDNAIIKTKRYKQSAFGEGVRDLDIEMALFIDLGQVGTCLVIPKFSAHGIE